MKQSSLRTATLIGVPVVTAVVLVGAMNIASAHETNIGNPTAERRLNFEEIRNLHEQGLHEEAMALMEESGWPDKHGRFGAHSEQREKIQQAIENNDYKAFVEATSDSPFADKIPDEATFEKVAEAHALKAQGDLEGAQSIMEEIGISPGRYHGKWHGTYGLKTN